MQVRDSRLVLRGSDGHRRLTELAWDEDWDLVEIRHAEPPFVEVWEVEGRGVEIHFVRDEMIGLEYVTFYGEDCEIEIEKVRDACVLWTREAALDSLKISEDRNDRLRSIYAAALASANDEDQDLISEFRSVTQNDPDPGIRQAVIVSTGYRPWSGLIDLVSEMRDSDAEPHIRRNAQIMLDGLRENPPESVDRK